MANNMISGYAAFVAALRAGMCITFSLISTSAFAVVTDIQIVERAPWLSGKSLGAAGSYERLQGKVTYSLDPDDAADAAVVDLERAPRALDGKVRFSGDFVVLRPADPVKAKPFIFLEALNRGRSQADFTFFSTKNEQPFRVEKLADTVLDDAFLFEQGYTVVWVGWEGGLANGRIGLDLPLADVHSLVREDALIKAPNTHVISLKQRYCAAPNELDSAVLLMKHSFEEVGQTIAPSKWQFAREQDGQLVPDPCSIHSVDELVPGALYEAVYVGSHSPVTGSGLAAVRDFASYLKYRSSAASSLTRRSEKPLQIVAYGYSQSARFFREYLYGGFNSDERGRKVFDGMFLASAGAGRGSFNHRYASPGDAGTSVLSDLRPVDIFPFADLVEFDLVTAQEGGVLTRAMKSDTAPKIFYTYSSTEYWARFGALLYTATDGRTELPLADTSRLYFFAGTPHAITPFPPSRHVRARNQDVQAPANFAPPDFGFRALLIDLEQWLTDETLPPDSVYPRLNSSLVDFADYKFPRIPGLDPPLDPPINWRLSFGPGFSTTGVITQEPPIVGLAYPLLVPRVDRDGNDLGGIELPFRAVPLGTYTGWNHEVPQVDGFHHLAGLIGSFVSFPLTDKEREANRDPRASIEARYKGRADYLGRVHQAAVTLTKERFLRSADIQSLEDEAARTWDLVTLGNRN